MSPVNPVSPVSPARAGYYDLPVVKAPPWKWYVPMYLYVGGVAGASSVLASAVEIAGGRALAPLGKRLRWTAAIGEALGGALLVADLGKPTRFYRMMMAVRPTSPMSVGTWILSTALATSGLGIVRELVGARPSRVLSAVDAVAGGMLASYTGVLVGNTALPAWNRPRTQLPLLFAASGAASAASLLELAASRDHGTARVARAFSIGAKAAEIAATHAVEHAVGRGVVGKPYREGRAGMLWRASSWLAVASLVATVLPVGGRTRVRLAGVLGTAAGLARRFAILEIGKASAADPRATLDG